MTPTLLLAGVSVRMLAQSAARAGIRPVSLDWFADDDTAASSAICRRVSDGTGFDGDELLRAAERFAPAGSGAALIYGGGFDGAPDLLSRLAQGRCLLGNRPETLRRIKSPRNFFRELDRLGIPYPETRWSPPEERHLHSDWLLKRASSEGGTGVFSGESIGRECPDASYFQRRVDGDPRSALFLANGVDSAVIGFNTLVVSDHRPHQPFLFAGARTDDTLGARLRSEIAEYTRALTRTFSLRGINSLDFMVDRDSARVLELNPRPSATMALYDSDYPQGLLARHIDVSRGLPLVPTGRPAMLRAFQILYARCPIVIPAGIGWPPWCADLTRAGTPIAPGWPVCSVRAEAPDRASLEAQLFTRARTIRASLMF